VVRGTVRSFSDEEGWGVIGTPEAPEAVFVFFGDIDMAGYKTLEVGHPVDFELEGPLPEPLEIEEGQSFRFRAKSVRPASSP